MRLRKILRKSLDILFNTRAAAVYLLLFSIAIGTATFIENDYGTSSAQKLFYHAWWFELLLILFAITLLYNIIKLRMIQRRKWANLIFHVAMIIILIGAGITRYFGSEGVMHIREGSSSNTFLSSDTYLRFRAISDEEKYSFDEPVLFASLGNNHFENSYKLGNKLVHIKLKEFIPNPAKKLVASTDGMPTLKVVMAGANGREDYFIRFGEKLPIEGQLFNFANTNFPNAVNLYWRNDSLLIRPNIDLTQMVMATQEKDTLLAGRLYPLRLRSLYSGSSGRFVFGDFSPEAIVKMESENRKMKSGSQAALVFDVDVDGMQKEVTVTGTKGLSGSPSTASVGDLQLAIAYGSKPVELPFKLKLYDFIMERYPGTNSAASYASEVQLIDHDQDEHRDFRIYMNHILNYRGYRFFQSSYDRDEKGTYLSVNHDFWGTWVSYLGYALLTLGLLMIFFTKNTRFRQLSQNLKRMRTNGKAAAMLLFFGLLSFSAVAQETIAQDVDAISKSHAAAFSKIIVQNVRGRMEPMHTLTREVMRKIHRSERFQGLNADQVILSMYAAPAQWYGAPLIKFTNNEKIQSLIGKSTEQVAYKDFFNEDGSYKLSDAVQEAFRVKESDRGTYEKALIKIDERVNIVNMVFSGSLFKIIPVPNDVNNNWVSTRIDRAFSEFKPTADKFFSNYKHALHDALHDGNYQRADKLLHDLIDFQQANGAAVMPASSKVSAEIFLNNLKVFNRLAIYYVILGLAFLILLFISVFKPALNLKKIHLILFLLVVLGFIFHTTGLGLRWYISGRAPWSNGYESMIYIAFTTTLAGIIFTRKSLGGLAATNILSGVILLIALLSYLDPEITPLVPVLKSYWLTIHVSLEAGSYGFLMLGAIIGLINLLLFTVLNQHNQQRIKRIVQEMTHISEMTLIGGLVMLSIGTYLGGVWANESWGRYWGWDAKETWALVSILIYAFILHIRLVPRWYSLFSFNLATLFGLGSIIMTYFGVNYYLSGLHSYAAGDPVPIPNWVYISVVSLVIISSLAYFKKRKYLV